MTVEGDDAVVLAAREADRIADASEDSGGWPVYGSRSGHRQGYGDDVRQELAYDGMQRMLDSSLYNEVVNGGGYKTLDIVDRSGRWVTYDRGGVIVNDIGEQYWQSTFDGMYRALKSIDDYDAGVDDGLVVDVMTDLVRDVVRER